jgi:hypothetical protein
VCICWFIREFDVHSGTHKGVTSAGNSVEVASVRPMRCTRWFKYDRDDLCVNKSQFVPVIFEPPCMYLRNKAQEITTYCLHREYAYVLINLEIVLTRK